MTVEATYKYLKLTSKKEAIIHGGYSWSNVGKIEKVHKRDLRGIIGILVNNGVLVNATEEEYNAQES